MIFIAQHFKCNLDDEDSHEIVILIDMEDGYVHAKEILPPAKLNDIDKDCWSPDLNPYWLKASEIWYSGTSL